MKDEYEYELRWQFMVSFFAIGLAVCALNQVLTQVFFQYSLPFFWQFMLNVSINFGIMTAIVHRFPKFVGRFQKK